VQETLTVDQRGLLGGIAMTAQFALSSDALPMTSRLRAVRGTERLSQPYAFDLVVELEPNALDDLDAPVGQPATLAFNDEHGNEQDAIHGILSQVELVDAQPERELYLARLVPRLWWLGQNRHSRVFVDEKLPTIIDRVLRSAGWGDDDFRLVLKGRPKKGFPVLEHVCQYRESDLDFLSRWMEREGIYYYFEEAATKSGATRREALVVTDDAEAHRSRTAGLQAYVPRAAAGGDRIEGFRSFRRTSHAQPAGVRLADFDYLNPLLPVQHQEKKGNGEVVSLFGENLATPDDAKWLTQLRMQELRAQQVIYRGAGRVHGIHPADQFSLLGHPRFTEDLLAVEVVHRGMDLEGKAGLREPIQEALGEELDDEYVVEVAAIPAAVQYRPPRVTPTPRITGMESALVDGEADDRYAQLDEHGRYKLRLKFDESDLEDGRASTRVRMMQPHGGAEEGFHFPLRKGTEVMVSFLGGDPDRPMIAGVTPNAHALSPVTRANATQNVVQTGGGNKLVMEDTAGSQSVHLSSPIQSSFLHLGAGPNNLELSTDGVGRVHTGAALTVDVGGPRTDHVTNDLHENYDAAQITTAKSRKEIVDGPVTETYKGHHEQKVTSGGVLREVTGREIENINDGRTQTIKSGLDQTVEGGATLTHEGGFHQKVDKGLVKVDMVGGQVTVDAKVGILLKSDGPILNKGATSLIVFVPSKIEIADFKGTVSKSAVWTASPMSIGNIGTVVNTVGIKAEVHGLRTDATKIQLNNTPMKLEDVKMAIVTGALLLQLAKFTILG
jgi:type VI secretion system secreted protein VgrG